MLLLLLVAGLAAAADVSTSKLQVHIPKSLSVKGGYEHRDALFGIPPYGGSIEQAVYYANSTFCEAGFQVDYPPPFILMVDRGGCTFVQKVRNAQHTGAAAVLIADNVCLCEATGCVMSAKQITCESTEPIMADDGSGRDITIPSFLVFKKDADLFKQTLLTSPMRMELSFSVPNPDGRVEYDLWMAPADPTTRPILKHFETAVLALGEEAFFTPHMFLYDGVKAGCKDFFENADVCGDMCTNHGRYCNSGYGDAGITGYQIVKESLRRICIWEMYGAKNGIGTEWWNYVKTFMDTCDDPEDPRQFSNDNCINQALTSTKINVETVNKCMADSGGVDEDVENTLLKQTLHKQDVTGAIIEPTMFVNQAPVRGEMVFSTIFKAVCSGYAKGSEPDVCQTCAYCHDIEQCVAHKKCTTGFDGAALTASGGVSHVTFVAALVGLTLLFTIVGVIVYRRQQTHMRDEIRSVMEQYRPVDPNKTVDSAVAQEDEAEFM